MLMFGALLCRDVLVEALQDLGSEFKYTFWSSETCSVLVRSSELTLQQSGTGNTCMCLCCVCVWFAAC
jgi:hypothetical protein